MPTLTTNEAASLAGVARITVIKWIARGLLPAQKFGRDWMIDEDTLRRVLPELHERRKGGMPYHKKKENETGSK